MAVVCVLLGGCWWTPPEVSAVSPTSAMPGDPFRLDGANFGEKPSVTLVLAGTRVPVPVSSPSEGQLEGDLPADLAPGLWEIEVQGDHGVAEVHPTLDVWTADSEPACAKRYALSSSATRQGKQLQVERIFADRAPVTLTLEATTLTALALESTPGAAGKPCSALWAARTDGTRVLVADDDTRDLTALATPIADALGLPLLRPGGAAPAVVEPVPADAPAEAPATP